MLIAIVPALLPGGGAATPVATPAPEVIEPEPELEPCFFWVEETYYEDSGEVIDRTEL